MQATKQQKDVLSQVGRDYLFNRMEFRLDTEAQLKLYALHHTCAH
jgi:hypothetical protein